MFAALLYHGVDSGQRWQRVMTAIDREYVLERARFAEHVEWMASHSVPVASLRECGSADAVTDRTRPSVALTFDDGDESGYTTTAPILERHGFRGEFFIVTQWIGRPGFMTARQLRELVARGHGVHSHSRTHPVLPSLDDAAVDREVGESKRELEYATGEPVEYFSIPNGASDARVLDAARRAGYVGVLNSIAGYNLRSDFVLRRFSALTHTSVAEIAAICERPYLTAARVAVKRSALSAAKRVLGGRYDALRQTLLSRRHS
jgi:peptidoglycan/xylan/chitin deacetylase (PgdA/CDA1 family)